VPDSNPPLLTASFRGFEDLFSEHEKIANRKITVNVCNNNLKFLIIIPALMIKNGNTFSKIKVFFR
jgi:hypothetical protein